jgi:hypothetical protein
MFDFGPLLQTGNDLRQHMPRLTGNATFSIIVSAGDEGWRQKADYILANPVRAGLAITAEDWPYILINER